MAEPRIRLGSRTTIALALLAGIVGVGVAMLVGMAPWLLDAIARPAPIVRAVLAGGAIVIGGRLLLSALRRIDGAFRSGVGSVVEDGGMSDADVGAMVRGVRLVFLAAAAFAAASGWILGEPLPLIIALVIAGVDVVETSFLLLVATKRA